MKRLICFLLIACLLLAGCGKAPEGTQTSAQTAAEASTEAASETAPEETLVSFTDDLGRELSIPQPKRVVTLIASFADVWCLAGGAESLVGVTNAVWTYYDLPLREDVVNLGSAKALNLEALIDCRPELVLASCGTDRNVELEGVLEDMGLTEEDLPTNLVELCAYRLTTPGAGKEVGASLNQLRGMYLGIYHAPEAVCAALKTSVFAAALFELMGYEAQ